MSVRVSANVRVCACVRASMHELCASLLGAHASQCMSARVCVDVCMGVCLWERFLSVRACMRACVFVFCVCVCVFLRMFVAAPEAPDQDDLSDAATPSLMQDCNTS